MNDERRVGEDTVQTAGDENKLVGGILKAQGLSSTRSSRHMFILAHLDSEHKQAPKFGFHYLKYLYWGVLYMSVVCRESERLKKEISCYNIF